MLRIHGTCVDLAGFGILLRGPSGAGKSDLALRLIDGGALLVADDQVELHVEHGALVARPPREIAGLLEVRGVGIVPVASVPVTRVRLVVDLVAADRVDRLPDVTPAILCGMPVRRLAIAPFEASTPAKLRLAAAAPTDIDAFFAGPCPS